MSGRVSWVALGCLLTAGCAEPGPTGTLQARNDGSEARVEARAVFPNRVFYSGVGQASRQVVRTEARWQALWAEVFSPYQPQPPAAAVDFGREIVVFAAMGGRATGGYGITVDSVTASTGTLDVYVTERSPGGSCATTQALTAPVDAVALPSEGRAVRFHDTQVVHNCS